MARKEHHKLIGHKNQEYYCLDTTFEHDDGHQGATGTVLYPVTVSEHEERMDKWENPDIYHPLHHVWVNEVKEEETLLSFKEWLAEIPQSEVIDLEYDGSGKAELHEKVKEKAEEELDEEIFIVECIAGGRCVDKSKEWYDKVYNEEAIETIAEYEEEMK